MVYTKNKAIRRCEYKRKTSNCLYTRMVREYSSYSREETTPIYDTEEMPVDYFYRIYADNAANNNDIDEMLYWTTETITI